MSLFPRCHFVWLRVQCFSFFWLLRTSSCRLLLSPPFIAPFVASFVACAASTCAPALPKQQRMLWHSHTVLPFGLLAARQRTSPSLFGGSCRPRSLPLLPWFASRLTRQTKTLSCTAAKTPPPPRSPRTKHPFPLPFPSFVIEAKISWCLCRLVQLPSQHHQQTKNKHRNGASQQGERGAEGERGCRVRHDGVCWAVGWWK